MRKIPFTLNEHVQLANDLDGMRSTVLQYVTRLPEAYPLASRQVKRTQKLLVAIDSLRCEMDNVFCREYPGEQFRCPHYEWVHTPYFNPESKKRIASQLPEQSEQ